MNDEQKKFYDTAVSFLGKDASPSDLADDSYGCAESWNGIYKATFGEFFMKTNRLSTYWLLDALSKSICFVEVSSPQTGDTIIAASGTGGTPEVPRGHVGICGENGIVMSSDSYNHGLWEENYSVDSFLRRYRDRGKFPVKFYRLNG